MTAAGIGRRTSQFLHLMANRKRRLHMVRTFAASLILIATATVHGEEARARADGPPLIKNAAPQANDSPLVRAARAAVAARSKVAATRPVIDDRTVLRGRVYQASGPNNNNISLPKAFEQPAPPTEPVAPNKAVAQAKQRVENLRQEQQLMAQEADQGPFDETGEDRVEQRMTEIPGEIDQAQRDMQAPTAPPPPL